MWVRTEIYNSGHTGPRPAGLVTNTAWWSFTLKVYLHQHVNITKLEITTNYIQAMHHCEIHSLHFSSTVQQLMNRKIDSLNVCNSLFSVYCSKVQHITLHSSSAFNNFVIILRLHYRLGIKGFLKRYALYRARFYLLTYLLFHHQ